MKQVVIAAVAAVPALALVHRGAHAQASDDRRSLLAQVKGSSQRSSQAPNVPYEAFEGGPGAEEFESVRTLVASIGYGRGEQQESTYEASDSGPVNHMMWNSMGSEFRFMDDMEPVAPMDRLAPRGNQVVTIKRVEDPGNKGALAYVPPGMFPDAFPVVSGPSCTCAMPNNTNPNITCKCDNKTDVLAFRWTRTEPVYNSSDYKLIPADLSYPDGDYWHPQVPDGNVISPEDKLPKQFYPLQARADKIRSLPAFAKEDRVPRTFAKYFDQVEARSIECDNVSPECTNPCVAGDKVQLRVGNVVVKEAEVLKAFVGNSMTVKLVPGLAEKFPGGPECKVDHGCTVFRSCYLDQMQTCTESKDSTSHDWQGNLNHKEECPDGSKACSTVEMFIQATMAEKDGKACKAAIK